MIHYMYALTSVCSMGSHVKDLSDFDHVELVHQAWDYNHGVWTGTLTSNLIGCYLLYRIALGCYRGYTSVSKRSPIRLKRYGRSTLIVPLPSLDGKAYQEALSYFAPWTATKVDEATIAYFDAYWLSDKEYQQHWKPLQEEIFDLYTEDFTPMFFQSGFVLMPLLGGSVLTKKRFLALQRCMRSLGEHHFVMVQSPHDGATNHLKFDASMQRIRGHWPHDELQPQLRFRFPVEITWEELYHKVEIAKHLFSWVSACKCFYLFGDSGQWGKYSAHTFKFFSLDVVGCLPACESFFAGSHATLLNKAKKEIILHELHPPYKQYATYLHPNIYDIEEEEPTTAYPVTMLVEGITDLDKVPASYHAKAYYGVVEHCETQTYFHQAKASATTLAASQAYCEAYWLADEAFHEVWKPLQDQIFDPQARTLPDMMFRPSFTLMPYESTYTLTLEQEAFLRLQQCMRTLGEHYFVIVSSPYNQGAPYARWDGELYTDPHMQFRFPVDITWEAFNEGGMVANYLLRADDRVFYIFGDSGQWGKFSMNNLYEEALNILAYKPAHEACFAEAFKGYLTPAQQEVTLSYLEDLHLPPAYRQYDKHLR